MTTQSSLPPLILAIDTSCDETSAAVTLGVNVLSNVVSSQAEIHEQYGGVFPTLAKRAHQQNIEPVIAAALSRAGVELSQLDAAAVTTGPGLAPALEIGIEHAQQLSSKQGLPLISVNHIEAHALSVLAEKRSRSIPFQDILDFKSNDQPQAANPAQLAALLPEWKRPQLNLFPVLALVVSGGHTVFLLIKQIGAYQVLGQTIDDAAGEALDKVGRMLNLGYPAAPALEQLAEQGNKTRFQFPLPMAHRSDFDLSYSGLKTHAHRLIKQLKAEGNWNQQTVKDFGASFQFAVFRHLTYKLDKLLETLSANNQHGIDQIWLGGGVARNIKLRRQLRKTASRHQLKIKTPFEKRLCSDNAAMIGIAANFHYQAQDIILPGSPQKSQLDRQPSWSIDQVSY